MNYPLPLQVNFIRIYRVKLLMTSRNSKTRAKTWRYIFSIWSFLWVTCLGSYMFGFWIDMHVEHLHFILEKAHKFVLCFWHLHFFQMLFATQVFGLKEPFFQIPHVTFIMFSCHKPEQFDTSQWNCFLTQLKKWSKTPG